MSELLPCAFCGEEARGIVEGVVFCDCGASAPISVWNTRAERTCSLVEESSGVRCSECARWYPSAVIHSSAMKYCERCGAKVVE